MDKGYLSPKGPLVKLNLATTAKRFKKGIVGIVGGLAVIAATGTLHGEALVIVNAIVAAATAAGVITARNADPVPTPTQPPITTP